MGGKQFFLPIISLWTQFLSCVILSFFHVLKLIAISTISKKVPFLKDEDEDDDRVEGREKQSQEDLFPVLCASLCSKEVCIILLILDSLWFTLDCSDR